MSQSYLTSYQPMPELPDDTETNNHDDFPTIIHVVPKSDKTRWNHIEDLDSFFTRIYQYHQKNGFLCMMVKQFLDLLNFLFIILFTTFLFTCIDYDALFRNKAQFHPERNNKTMLSDCINMKDAGDNMTPGMWFLMIAALGFWLVKIFVAFICYFQFCDIKIFYNVALGISDDELQNVTWEEVQKRLMEVQIEQRMCIHKEALTELDIYHRILRFTNYFIAMVHKNVIPLKFKLPIMGEMVFLSRGLRFNIDFLLFSGIGAPFKNNWHLKEEFKRAEHRHHLAEELSKRITYVAIVNFVFFPFIFIFQILRSFYHYTGIIRREPGFLGVRRWSHYGLVTLRHYNELNHELQARLNRGYRCGAQYMNSFTSALATTIASHAAFICGAVLAVLVVLTIYDEDVLQVEHILTVMTILAAVTACCRIFIPKENLVWCPEILMKNVLAEVHYLPESWKDKAHTSHVRNEFSQIFQYRFVHLIESLLSPLITPAVLYFQLRNHSLEIVDFFRNFTVEVIGVGDICSFAQMSLPKHGSRTWHPNLVHIGDSTSQIPENPVYETDHGKTELSLLHFALTNPNWKPPQESEAFLNALRAQAKRDFANLPAVNEENALYASMNSLSLNGVLGNNRMHSRWLETSTNGESVCGRINQMEGSRHGPSNGILGSLTQLGEYENRDGSSSVRHRKRDPTLGDFAPPARPQDMVAADMSVSTLYLHELHRRQRAAANYADAPVNLGPTRAGINRAPIQSYYHSTDPPSAGGSLGQSYFPSQGSVPVPASSGNIVSPTGNIVSPTSSQREQEERQTAAADYIDAPSNMGPIRIGIIRGPIQSYQSTDAPSAGGSLGPSYFPSQGSVPYLPVPARPGNIVSPTGNIVSPTSSQREQEETPLLNTKT